MMTRFTSMTIAFVLLMQLMLTPFTFAQTGEQQEVPSTQEMEVCNLPWDDYKIFTNYRLGYQTAIADEDPVFAQDLFESMQDILASHCDAVASIIQVQSDDVDATCNTLVNQLLAKNNYYVRSLDTDNAIATQGLIQTVLTAQDCAPILAPDSEVAIDLIQEDIAAQQTIDLDLEVIPYANNVCFNTYGPSHAFTQQVENIQDATVATSVFDTVNNYFAQLGATAIDEIQQYREGTLLNYAKNLLGFRQDALRNLQYKANVLPFQIAEGVSLAAGITDAQGIQDIQAIIDTYIQDIGGYIEKFGSDPLRATFDEPRAYNTISHVMANPLTLVRDDLTQSFSHEVGEKGLQVVFPAVVTQEPDPLDPQTMIDVVQKEELVINILDIQGTAQMISIYDENIQETVQEEDYRVSKIVAEIQYAGKKVTAADITIQYNDAGDMTNLQIAWYLDPYIYTNNFSTQRTTDVAGNEIETTTMDIRIFGPAGCDVQLMLDATTTIDTEKNETSTQDITFVLNNTRVEISTQNFDAMIGDIFNYRQTVPTATSTPQTASYLVDAKIYHKGVYRAYLYPENNTWNVGFASQQEPQDFINELLNPIAGGSFDHITTLQSIRSMLAPLFANNQQAETVSLGCTDNTAINYNPDAMQDDGSCDYTPTDNNTGTGDNTVLGCTNPEATNYDPNATKDDKTCTYSTGTGDANTGTGDANTGTGTNPVPGCTNPQATNYNSEATTDDGSCTLPQSGPVVGCPDPGATNYTEGADENDESNWAMCIR